MLLHMLMEWQPWTRCHTCRLYLKIANEPPPLRDPSFPLQRCRSSSCLASTVTLFPPGAVGSKDKSERRNDSGRWSLSPGDDPSSGCFSSNSQPEVQPFSMGLLGQVGHIATGINEQISVFTLETARGRQVPHNQEVQESGLELRCVPDFSHAWTIKDVLLETRESPQSEEQMAI
ncbi:uncharacterized protein LOC144994204 [Oryzias latipes]